MPHRWLLVESCTYPAARLQSCFQSESRPKSAASESISRLSCHVPSDPRSFRQGSLDKLPLPELFAPHKWAILGLANQSGCAT